MAATVKDILKAVESFKIYHSPKTKPKKSVTDELLGKYKGIIPKGKTSTQFIKELRSALYGISYY